MNESRKLLIDVAAKISQALAELETVMSENDLRITDEMFVRLCAAERMSAKSVGYGHRTLAALEYARATLNVFLEE